MVSRRAFVGRVLAAAFLSVATARAQGLDQFAVSEPPCTDDPRVTPAVPRDGRYRAGAPVVSVLAGARAGSHRLALSGTVTGVTCGRVAGARVNLWHADERGQYDMAGFRFRGQQVTDKLGTFAFETSEPGVGAGRAKHLCLRVHVPGKIDFSTEVFFPDDPKAAGDARFKKELLLRLVRQGSRRAALFDVVLPI